jgi:hypothetical protein
MSKHLRTRLSWAGEGGGSLATGGLQRTCSCGQHTSGGQCEECKKKHGMLQRHPAGSSGPTIPPIVHEVLRSPGQALDAGTRAFLEPRFGRDLSGVRVHTDSDAVESARVLNALAYTVRNDIVFGADQYSPHERRGRGLLAHELSHVVQQSALTHPVVQYQKSDTGPRDVHPDPIDDVLPRGLGLVADLDRRFLLIDIFGEQQLEEMVSEIKSDPSALAFTRKTGILGFLALADTRQGKKVNVAQAQTVLDADAKKPKLARRYQRVLLEPRSEAAKSLWFQPKPPEAPASGKDIDQIPIGNDRSSVVEDPRNPFTVPPPAGEFPIVVNFAFMGSDRRGQSASPEINRAETAILDGIRRVFQDLLSVPPAPSQAVRTADEQRRARLKEALRRFGIAKPLRIFISSDESALLTGLSLRTEAIFIRQQDIGNDAKLEAAIRVPVVALIGSQSDANPMTQEEAGEAILHEMVHAMLIRRHASANDLWQTINTQLVTGPRTVKNRCEELIHRYLLAQEEVFTYQSVSELGSAYSHFSAGNQPRYELFIAATEAFFRSKNVKLEVSKKKLDVTEKVGGKKVDWSIEIHFPRRVLVAGADLTLMNDLIASVPG